VMHARLREYALATGGEDELAFFETLFDRL
jgi:hypothetical protein